MNIKKLNVSKKVKLIIVVVLFLFIFLGYLLSPIYSVEGVYRSYLAETLANDFKGYLCFKVGNAYAVNLSADNPEQNSAELIGSYEIIAGNRYKVTTADKRYLLFEAGLFGLTLVEDSDDILQIYESFPFNEGLKTVLPATIKQVNEEVNKLLGK